MKINVCVIKKVVCTSLMFAVTGLAQARVWTSTSGKTVDADFVRMDGDKVVLKRNNDGKTFKVAKTFFVQKDQDIIATLSKTNTETEGEKKDPVKTFQTGGDVELNFDAEWPKLVSLKRDFSVKLIEGEEAGKFVYHSKHFEFVSDVRLSNSVVKRFGEIFEATLAYVQKLPISSQKAIKHSAEKKKQIFLYSNTNDYYKAGGPRGSAGVYMGSRDIIMVGMEFLGLKKMGSGYTLDRKDENKTLPHEVVHMFTDFEYYAPGAMGWFSEGLAEYVAVTPYRGGKFMVSSNRKAIIEYVTAFGAKKNGGRNLGKEINVGSLKSYMLQPYSQFTSNAGHNYGVGALITYYFFHFEKNGRENITNFLKALRERKRGEEALKVLLNGRTFEELEKDIHSAWRSRGVKLHFSKGK